MDDLNQQFDRLREIAVAAGGVDYLHFSGANALVTVPFAEVGWWAWERDDITIVSHEPLYMLRMLRTCQVDPIHYRMFWARSSVGSGKYRWFLGRDGHILQVELKADRCATEALHTRFEFDD